MQIQPAPVPLANTGSVQSTAAPEAPAAAKPESARPVESAQKDPSPRFPYPDPDRGQRVNIEA